jgi:O-antigen ligase
MASNPELVRVRRELRRPSTGSTLTLGRGPFKRLIVAAFVVFVSSIPFEAVVVGQEGRVSFSRLLGYLFFGLALLQPGLCFRKPPRALWWFALYLGFYVLNGLSQASGYWPDIASTAVRLAQFIVLLWVAYNLLQYDRVAKLVWWGFGLSCVAVGCLLVSGVGTSIVSQRTGRQTIFGEGANTIAGIIGLGAVALIGMVYGRAGARKRVKLAAWASFLIVVLAITRTGSRGALVGLGAGVMTLLASRGSARIRMRNALIVTLALGASTWLIATSAITSSRWEETLEEGSMSGRQRIYREAVRMVEEKPILGWGPVTNFYELGRRLGLPKRDTHNLFLWLLTEQGLVGAVPFCIGLWVCGRAAWRGRHGLQGLLPLALFVAALTLNLAGTYYVTKWFWVILAYTVAGETYARRRSTRSSSISEIRSGSASTGFIAAYSFRKPG